VVRSVISNESDQDNLPIVEYEIEKRMSLVRLKSRISFLPAKERGILTWNKTPFLATDYYGRLTHDEREVKGGISSQVKGGKVCEGEGIDLKTIYLCLSYVDQTDNDQ